MEKLIIFIVFLVVSKIIESIRASRSNQQQSPVVIPQPVPRSMLPGDGASPSEQQDWDFPSQVKMEPTNVPRPSLPTPKPVPVTAGSGRKSRPGKTSSATPNAASSSKSRSTRATGAGVRAHVESFIGDHVREHMDSHIDTAVRKHIDQHVQQHIGTGLSADSEESTLPQSVGEIRRLLQSPDGARKAILINEILTRPRSLSRGR